MILEQKNWSYSAGQDYKISCLYILSIQISRALLDNLTGSGSKKLEAPVTMFFKMQNWKKAKGKSKLT